MAASRLPLICIYLATSSSGFILPSAARTSSNNVSPLIANSAKSVISRSIMASSTDSAAAGLGDIGNGSSNSGKGSNKGRGRNNSAPDEAVVPWRERINGSIARSRKIRGGNYVQIATVDPETSEPRCRTVVFRGFLSPRPKEEGPTVEKAEESCVMKMITDLRSSKVGEASGHTSPATANTCELVWWFSKSSEQYRVRGSLQFVGGDESDDFLVRMRKEQWGNLSDMAREQFYWRDPSIEYEPQLKVPEGGRGDDGKVLPPPDNFLLMLLNPTRVDYLRLGDNFRQFDELDGDKWTEKRVNP